MQDIKLSPAQRAVIQKMKEGAVLHILCDHRTIYRFEDAIIQFRIAWKLEQMGLIAPVQDRPNSHGYFELTPAGRALDL